MGPGVGGGTQEVRALEARIGALDSILCQMGSHQRDLNEEVTGPNFKGTLDIVWRMLEVGNSGSSEIVLGV